MLWGDNWSGTILKNSLPHLLSFTRKPKCSINYLVQHQDLDRMFSLPLSSQAADQLTELQALLEARLLDDENKDSWTYIWGAMATILGKSISIYRVYM